MSDQVVFTKEEVERIRTIVSNASSYICTDCHGCDTTDEDDCTERLEILSALSLLDSPRPRPKVKWDFLQAIYRRGHGDCENGNNPVTGYIGDICIQHGFDVED